MTNNKLINYDQLVDDALRSVVKIVLNTLDKNEPIGDHHFFITFLTKHKNVLIPNSFMENHPNTMTIVLQHQFWDLEVGENKFSVKLSFNGKQEKLSVGYDAITQFTDPSTDFSLQFTSQDEIVNDKNLSVKKVKEEIGELIDAIEKNSNKIHESADVLYHLMVLLEANSIKIEDVMDELKKRQK